MKKGLGDFMCRRSGRFGNWRHFVLAVALFPTAAAGSAEASGPVTLDSAAREAVAWHPSVTEAIGRLNSSATDIDVAKAGYLPQIRAGIGSNYDNSLGASWRPRASVSASQMLFDFGKVSSDVDIAESGRQISRAELLLAVDSLIRDTSYAVIEVQRTAALHEAAIDQLASIRDISNLVDHRFQRGAATKSDALQAQARVQAAQATIEQISAEQRRWNSNLAFLLGRPEAPQVSPDVPGWFLDSCRRPAPEWSSVPAIMQARAERDQALAERNRERANRFPTISLGADASGDVNGPFSRRSQYSFGLNVSSTLFSGGATKARVRGANYALSAAEAAEARVRNEVSRLLAEAQSQVGSFDAVLTTLGSRQESMRETGKLYRLQYLEMGTRTLVDLLNAEQELNQVRFDFVNTQHDLRRLQVDCLYNAGAERDVFGLSGTTVRGVTL